MYKFASYMITAKPTYSKVKTDKMPTIHRFYKTINCSSETSQTAKAEQMPHGIPVLKRKNNKNKCKKIV